MPMNGVQSIESSIPTCGHTGLTLPECSCSPCLRDMLVRVGFEPSAVAGASK